MRLPLLSLIILALAILMAPTHAATVMGDYGVSTTGYISTTQLITTNVSLTTGATTWGYISSTGAYLPNLASNRISTTSISVTNITITGTPTATTDAANKAYVDSVASAAGGGAVACSNMGSAACTLSRIGTTYFAGKTLNSLAVSSDGTKMAVTTNAADYIYTSSDGGTTWTQRTGSGSRSWQKVTISDNGNILYAFASGTYGSSTAGLMKSTDGGATWTQMTGYGAITYAVSQLDVSADGSTLIMAAASGSSSNYAVYSINGGSSWTALVSNSSYAINGVSVSPSGMNLLYSYYNGSNYFFYKIINRGAATLITSNSSYFYGNHKILDDANYYYVFWNGSSYTFYKVYANGTSKTLLIPTPVNANMSNMAVSASGNRMYVSIAATANGPQISTDGGDTFTTATFLGGVTPATNPVIDASGKIYFIRGVYDSPIYVITCP